MQRRSFAFRDAVGPIWVRHDRESFISRYQFIDEIFGLLIVDVVVARAVNDKQIAL